MHFVRLTIAVLGSLVIAACTRVVLAADDDAEAARRASEFRQQVEPLLAKYCQRCHSGDEPKGDLAIGPLAQRADASADRQTWEKIAEKLRVKEMPPEDEPQPTADEQARIVRWVDNGLAGFACGREHDPGRVTMRRLNRNEYNNTIRDLVGVDFQPADDFPSDDVGYGFDNIGDVLSMPPILLEKYLAAAEKIVERAIGTGQANLVTGEITGGQDYEGSRILPSLAEVRAKVRMFGQGDYIIRVRAYGEQAGDEPVKMGLYLDNKTLRIVDVKATEKEPAVYEAWVSTKGGQHVVSITFLNDYYEPDQPPPNDRNLIISDVEVMGPYPPAYKRIIAREHTPEERMGLAREVLSGFATRAFRRPATPAEVDRLMKLVELADGEGENFAGAIGVALQAILVSPHFLFRVELDPNPGDAEPRIINDYELASRLSYFFWSSMPDDELMTHARLGTLRKDGNLEAQLRRMLADPKSRALVEHFAGQWLQLRNLTTMTPDKGTYPDFDEPLRRAMRRETELFFTAVMNEDRSVLDFLDGDFTFVNERLARHYGLEGIKGEKFQRVSLDGQQRSGVLTQASVLTVTSNPTRTSPVKRGKWILENVLGTPPPPPPPGAGQLAEDSATVSAASLRERMQQHRAKAECGVCHNRMDPLGFGLENFDGIGAWREADGKFKIDSSGTLPGGATFAGPRELKQILRQRQDDFVRCLAEKMLTYALGRGVEYSDKCSLTDLVAFVKDHDYKFSSLVVGIVQSDPFQKRGGKEDKP
jgi:hypothetical protein